MAGLINSTIQDPTQTPVLPSGQLARPGSTTYDPATRAVDPNTETVSGQVGKVLAADSPVIQQARAGAMQTMNARGLLNSSMAVGAGEDAAIKSAVPIASQDAATYSAAASQNQQSQNAALGQGAQAASTAQEANAAAQNTQAIQQGLQTLKGTQATGLANIEANYKELLQASDSASRLFQTTQAAIAQIQSDPNTSADQKAAAVQQMTKMLQSGLSVTGAISNINLAALLTFS